MFLLVVENLIEPCGKDITICLLGEKAEKKTMCPYQAVQCHGELTIWQTMYKMTFEKDKVELFCNSAWRVDRCARLC